MFLIEGNGNAILYTGDIRAEPWWINTIIRSPVLIPYTIGNNRLNRIYLDTALAGKSDQYTSFPTKAEGIRELLQKVQAYPQDTVFYLRNWTFGYEDVWLALSAALNTKVHVDSYQLKLYNSLASKDGQDLGIEEASYLCGFRLGNSWVPGCLTAKTDSHSARIHSCEPGVVCSTISTSPSVFITPIVTRNDEGSDIMEIGAGGGMGDLMQNHNLQLPDDAAVGRFITLCSEQIQDDVTRNEIISAVSKAYVSESKSLSLDSYGIKEEDEITLTKLVSILSHGPKKSHSLGNGETGTSKLPSTIRFPYSRHSSYEELCALVSAFRPRDVYPCTIDADTWCESISMEALFGKFCSDTIFLHDNEMRELVEEHEFRPQKRARCGSDTPSVCTSTQASIVEPNVSQDPLSSKPTEQLKTMKHAENTNMKMPTTQLNIGATNGDVDAIIENIDFSFPSQLSSDFSESQFAESSTTTNNRMQAIKKALKEKAFNNELEFFFDSSSDSISLPPSPKHNSHSGDRRPTVQGTPVIDEKGHSHSEQEIEENDGPPTSPLSLSSSAFASQGTIQIPSDSEDRTNAATSEGLVCENQEMPSLKRTRSRISAYRAARGERWSAFHSLISAGNNHTTRDEEL
ncbi:hypothetical protein LOZ36_000113 [Ophidiomyces ophidiicola]|nr:hypothetical protein LOZ36_000113 [Ophidiomyces ophidiicola]